MFGNVPRALWQRWYEPDKQGRIALSTRCFLVEEGGLRILIETGVGAFFEPRLKERFGVIEEQHVLLESLADRGLSPADIDVVLLSHLHFDHAGGLLSTYRLGEAPRLVFPNAQFLTSRQAWERAQAPHLRDRASFIETIVRLLADSGRLHLVEEGKNSHKLLPESFYLRQSQGHTAGMLIPTLEGQVHRATFCADLVPGTAWTHLPITMGYDRFAERLIDEKRGLFEAVGEGSWLLYTHDPVVAAGQLSRDEEGRYRVVDPQGQLDQWDLDEDAAPPSCHG